MTILLVLLLRLARHNFFITTVQDLHGCFAKQKGGRCVCLRRIGGRMGGVDVECWLWDLRMMSDIRAGSGKNEMARGGMVRG